MAIRKMPSHSVSLRAVSSVPISTAVATVAVTLVSLTVKGTTPNMVYLISPHAAPDAGVMFGAPYCVTAGTLVVPVINPTAATVTTAAAIAVTILGF
jgi:hypothetical protein